MFDCIAWTCARIVQVDRCDIISASISPDFSFLLYTTVSFGRDQFKREKTYFETVLADIRILKGSNRYIIHNGNNYQYAQVFFISKSIYFYIFYEFLNYVYF